MIIRYLDPWGNNYTYRHLYPNSSRVLVTLLAKLLGTWSLGVSAVDPRQEPCKERSPLSYYPEIPKTLNPEPLNP